jgi:hypothetical protein
MSQPLRLLIYIAFIFVHGYSLPVEAVTLFIDFNNADSEIQAFKTSRVGRRETFLVLPSYERISAQQRAAARRANSAIEQLTLLAQQCAVTEGKKQSVCHEVYRRIRKAELARIEATGSYSVTDLKTELGTLLIKNPDLRVDMLVVSGHHERGFYRGELSQATDQEFDELIQKSRVLFTGLNTVVLLGCSTGTRASFQNYLSPIFPKITLVVGAEDSAPTRDESRNLSFIKKFNASRLSLLNSQSHKEVEPIVKGLRAENWPISLLWRNRTLFLKEGIEQF